MTDLKKYKEKYEEAKKILDIAIDTDNPMSKFVRENMTFEQAVTMQAFIAEAEDAGINLISKEAN